MKNKFLLASLLLLFISACSSGNGNDTGSASGRTAPGVQKADIAMSVEATKISRRSISEYVITNTSLESIREVIVYSKVSAMVTERNFEEGDIVKEGDLLVRLYDEEMVNNLEQAKISLVQSEVAVQQAEVNAELSAAEFERVKSLHDQQLISKQEYDQSEISSRSDSLSLDNAKQQLEAAKSRLAAAEIQLSYTTVKSPISGVVTIRLVNIGDRVSANQQLLTIQEFPPLWAKIYVPEKSIPKIKVGQLARLEMETYPDREFTGLIKLISPTVESASGTIKVTIEVNKNIGLLMPGMFGSVYIATDTHENAVVVPKKSIIRERNTNYVYTINSDNTVTRQAVTTGFADEDQVEIVAGLNGNEAIVTVGQETLSDGYPVMVQSWSDGSDGSGAVLGQAAKPAAAVDTAAASAATEHDGSAAEDLADVRFFVQQQNAENRTRHGFHGAQKRSRRRAGVPNPQLKQPYRQHALQRHHDQQERNALDRRAGKIQRVGGNAKPRGGDQAPQRRPERERPYGDILERRTVEIQNVKRVAASRSERQQHAGELAVRAEVGHQRDRANA